MTKRFVILGAGISGLALGWFLKQRWGGEATITIIEKSDRAGGWIRTVNEEGFLFEQGPRSCRVRGEETTTLELIEQLGLQNEVIAGDPSSKVKYLWSGSTLHKMPTSPLGALIHPLTRKAIFPCIRELFRPSVSLPDETVYDFISRRFNSTIAEQFIDPLMSGIYAGDMKQLSIKSCLPHLYYWEKNHGSVIRGMFKQKKSSTQHSPFIKEMLKEPLFSFKQGMETLPRTLYEKLKDDILLSTEVKTMKCHDDGITLTLNNRQQLHADHCFSTLPAEAIAPLLPPSISQELAKCKRSTVAMVNLGYTHSVLKHKGFGYLIPEKEKENILGVVWDSAIFPQQQQNPDYTRLTVMLGGSRTPEIAEMNDQELAMIAMNAISKHLKINSLPHTLRISHAHNAIPQYPVGHSNFVHNIHSLIPPHLTLAGTSFNGVAINDCISMAKRLASKDMMQK